jgi:aspartate/methionine/tyrosine aminotransferase
MHFSERMKNVVINEPGAPYQSHRISSLATAARMKGEDIIDTTSNAILMDTQAAIKEAAKKALDEGYTRGADVMGLPELREAIAGKLVKMDGIRANPETEILVTHGAEEAIFLAMQALIDPGDEVIECSPDYPFYLNIQNASGIPVYVPLRKNENWRLEPKDIEAAVTLKTRMIALDSPHNPTGRVFTRAELEGIAQVARQHDLLVVSDVANEMLAWDGRKNLNIASLPGMQERAVTTSSVSKCYGMSGWRVGYACGNRDLIFQMCKLHAVACNVGPATFAQKGAAALYANLPEVMEGVLEPYEKKRDFAVRRLNEMPRVRCHKPEGGAVLMPDISEYGMSSLQFAEWLLREAKVAAAPGSGYLAEGHIRVNFGEARLEELLDRLDKALERLASIPSNLKSPKIVNR